MGGDYKILVIDDQEIIFRMIHKSLTSVGFKNVDYAPNGKTGIEMEEKNNYDLITCDITMPGLNGIETVTEILKKNPSKKIIMVTALGQEDYVKQAMKLGIKNYLLKPFSPDKLVKTIATVFTTPV
ncbi:MAG: response regulator [Candidatus Gastranaerophilales bacterium]|nr:response regulator [Candidatus Gastranaerophilales bacterium]